jgi:hypothetical protein
MDEQRVALFGLDELVSALYAFPPREMLAWLAGARRSR